MTKAVVYLDFASTTPLAPEAASAMQKCVLAGSDYGNPASQHAAGRKSLAAVNRARGQLACLLRVPPESLIWTSGATESNNLAIQGVARTREHRGKHLVTMQTEHKAVVDTFRALEREGYEVTWLAPAENGLLSIDALVDTLRSDTQLVSIMHINNETGLTQDVHALGNACRKRGVLFHVDAAQSVGKVDFDLKAAPIDLLSMTGHKFYGPQGIGALYVADAANSPITPLLYGGGQERRLRPGTLPVHLIIGIGIAAEIAQAQMADDLAHLTALNDRLWKAIADIPGVLRNGSDAHCFPGILNVSVADVNGEGLMLGMEPVCVSSGSACNSTSGESSHVLRALGRSDREALGAVRFSFGRPTTDDDVDVAVERYRAAISHMRMLAVAP